MVNLGELAEVALGAGLGLAVIVAFAVALSALIRASESRRGGRPARAVGFGAIAAFAFAGALVGALYGLAVIAQDSPLG